MTKASLEAPPPTWKIILNHSKWVVEWFWLARISERPRVSCLEGANSRLSRGCLERLVVDLVVALKSYQTNHGDICTRWPSRVALPRVLSFFSNFRVKGVEISVLKLAFFQRSTNGISRHRRKKKNIPPQSPITHDCYTLCFTSTHAIALERELFLWRDPNFGRARRHWKR